VDFEAWAGARRVWAVRAVLLRVGAAVRAERPAEPLRTLRSTSTAGRRCASATTGANKAASAMAMPASASHRDARDDSGRRAPAFSICACLMTLAT
jgi:hypothetical protein